MKKINTLLISALLILLSSCSIAKDDDWTVTNNSSKVLSVYDSENASTIYSLEQNASIIITKGTEGGIYAVNQPYSVERKSNPYNVIFSDKTLYTYSIINTSTVYDVKLTFTNTDGDSTYVVISKSSSSFGNPVTVSSYSDSTSFSCFYIDWNQKELSFDISTLSISLVK